MIKNREKQSIKEDFVLNKLKHIISIFDRHLLHYLGMLLLIKHTHIKKPYLDKNNTSYI